MNLIGKARGVLLAVGAFSLHGSEWVGIEDFGGSSLDSSLWDSPTQQEGSANFEVSAGRMFFSIPESGNHTTLVSWKPNLPKTQGWFVEAFVSGSENLEEGDKVSTGFIISTAANPTLGGDGIVMRVESQILDGQLSRRLLFEEKSSGQVFTHYDFTETVEDTSVRLKFQFIQEANFVSFCYENTEGLWSCVAAGIAKWDLSQAEGLKVAALATANLSEVEGEQAWIDDFYIYIDESDKDGDGIAYDEENELGTNPYAADTDGDGLTDSEELETYQTDPRLSDSDNDTYPDGLEVLAGENPKEKADLPSLLSPEHDAGAGSRSLQMHTFPGLSYQVQYSSDLQTWTNQGSAIVGTGTTQFLDLGDSLDSTEFYRIQISD